MDEGGGGRRRGRGAAVEVWGGWRGTVPVGFVCMPYVRLCILLFQCADEVILLSPSKSNQDREIIDDQQG